MKNNTETFLKSISARLSSRRDCKGVEYCVTIQNGELYQYIEFYPDIFVFPNTHTRHRRNRYSILQHILLKSSYTDGEDPIKTNVVTHCLSENTARVYCYNSNFVPGKYKYIKSVSGKQRKWIKMI